MLKIPKTERSDVPSVVDVLKQLVLQALRIDQSMLNERACALSAARFQSARTEAQWFDLLGSVIPGFPRL